MRSTNHGRANHRPARVPSGAPDLARRALLVGDAPGPALLPPWSLAPDDFDQACTRCGKCVDACPTHVLKLAAGTVQVDFADGECTFCGECVEACPEPAFDVAARATGARPWAVVARIDATRLRAPRRRMPELRRRVRAAGDPVPPAAERIGPRTSRRRRSMHRLRRMRARLPRQRDQCVRGPPVPFTPDHAPAPRRFAARVRAL